MERAIRYVRDSFWAGRTFTTLAECNRQAWVWRDQSRINGVGRQILAARSNTSSPKNSRGCYLRLFTPSVPTESRPCGRTRPFMSASISTITRSRRKPSGRPLTLVASDTLVRILDGTTEVARHQRTYDRHSTGARSGACRGPHPAKRKAFHATPAGRLALAIPESETLLDLAFAQGESAGSQTAQLLKLLDGMERPPCAEPSVEALERNTPRASSVAFLLRSTSLAPRRLALDLSHHPEAQSVEVRPHDLEIYDELAHPNTTTIPNNSLPAQLQQIGLRALPGELDDFLTHATKARWSPARDPGANGRKPKSPSVPVAAWNGAFA